VPTISVNRRPWKVRLAVAGSRVALDRVEIWKQLQGTPQRISELEKRVAELEGKIGGKWPADVCKYCGARAVRLHSKLGPLQRGKMRERWKCGECNRMETRLVLALP
jgi:hypothetical protein